MWTASDEGGGGNQPDVLAIKRTSRNEILLVFREPVLESNTPRPRVSISQYIWRFGRFYAGGGVCQTNDVGQEGGVSKKSVFARTSLMDDH